MSRTTSTVLGAVVFTDLVGFTEFTDARGDIAALEVLECQLTIVCQSLSTIGDGRVVKEIGDGLMLWFPVPSAAIAAARNIRDHIRDARADGFPLAMRLGVHAGEVIERGDDLIGHCVNVASRIADRAGPDEVLVSDDALADAGDERDRALPIGAVYVKGVADPVWLSRL